MRRKPILRGTARGAERGSTLVVALIFSMVLALIMAASISRSVYSWLNTQRSYRHSQALQVAESGLEQTLSLMNANLNFNYDYTMHQRSVSDGWGSGIGQYIVSVEPSALDADIKILTARGAVPGLQSVLRNKSERTVRIAVRRTTFDLDLWGFAIYTPTYIDLNGITEIHGDTKSGELVESTANIPDPHDRIEQFTYDWFDEENGVWVFDEPAEVYEGFNMDADPTNDVVLPFDEYILEALQQISLSQGYYFDTEPRPEELPTSFFQPDGITPNVVYISDDIHLSGNYNFGGLIIVVGDVISDEADAAFGGNHDVDGIIYTTGGFRTHGGGENQISIDGGVFCGSADLQGHTVVEYNWTYMNALKDLVFASNKFRFFTWRELLGEEAKNVPVAHASSPY